MSEELELVIPHGALLEDLADVVSGFTALFRDVGTERTGSTPACG